MSTPTERSSVRAVLDTESGGGRASDLGKAAGVKNS
jgi:hypothetical protein